jgi:hypothetical protein
MARFCRCWYIGPAAAHGAAGNACTHTCAPFINIYTQQRRRTYIYSQFTRVCKNNTRCHNVFCLAPVQRGINFRCMENCSDDAAWCSILLLLLWRLPLAFLHITQREGGNSALSQNSALAGWQSGRLIPYPTKSFSSGRIVVIVYIWNKYRVIIALCVWIVPTL